MKGYKRGVQELNIRQTREGSGVTSLLSQSCVRAAFSKQRGLCRKEHELANDSVDLLSSSRCVTVGRLSGCQE